MGWLEGIISGAGSILGGVTSNLINQNQQENEATRNQSNFDIQQDNFLRNAQIRSEDAKKAGLHPLYALGGNAAQPSGSIPIVMQDSVGGSLNQAGQNLSSAMARTASGDDRIKTNLEIQLMKHQITESDARAQMYLSEAAKNNQAGVQGLGIQPETSGLGAPEGQAPMNLSTGIIDVRPSPQLSTKKGWSDTIAGTGSVHEERMLYPGFPMQVPRLEGESLEEILSEMSPGAFMGMLMQNSNLYGGNWLNEFIDYRYYGKTPTGKYKSMTEIKSGDQGYGKDLLGMLQMRKKPKTAQEKIDEVFGQYYKKGGKKNAFR